MSKGELNINDDDGHGVTPTAMTSEMASTETQTVPTQLVCDPAVGVRQIHSWR